MYYLWQNPQFMVYPLHTTDNRSLSIVRAGQLNSNSGPDFLFSQIQLNQITWIGHVEMHVQSSDWYAHNHHTDVAYNNVILHVVWEDDVQVHSSDDEPIPTLVLQNYVNEQILGRIQALSDSEQWIPCADQLATITHFRQMAFFDRLFVERLANKTKVFQQWLSQSANDWEAVLFVALAKGFGLALNGMAFAAIAQSIPFNIIRKSTDPIEIEAILLGQAGLLDSDVEDAYKDKLKRMYQYACQKYKLKKIDEKVKFFRTRPSGFPSIRLSQLAQLYTKHTHLFDKIINGDCKDKVSAFFEVEASPFWHTHYVFGKENVKRKKVLTASFIDLLTINTLIPFLFCYYKANGVEKIEGLIHWASSLKPESNGIIRAFSSLGISTASALDSQALLQLKHYYCEEKKCLSCSFGHELIQS